jgi:hypothetical protein
MILSDTQTLILTAAAQHPKGIAAPSASLPPAPRAAVAKAMLRAGLLVAVEAEHDGSGAAWKLDGATVVLRITEAGLGAIGFQPQNLTASPGEIVPDAPAAASADGAATALPTDRDGESLAAAGAECAPAASQPADAAHDPFQAQDGALPPPSLRAAARAVLAAWDAPDHPDLAAAVDALRAALPIPATAPRSTAPRPPRPDTKQAQVLALLRRPEGASGPQLIEATGWAPHTVRGFLAGLARKSIAVTVLERVRQVGPNKAGAKGSYSIYHIAEVG